MKGLVKIICAVMLLLLLTAEVLAAESGTCGESLVWTLDTESGELVISGSGDMPDFGSCSDAPWYEHRASVKKVTVAEGVTSVGSYAFDWVYGSLSEAVLADSVKKVGYKAFSDLSLLKTVDLGEGIEEIGMYAFSHTSVEELAIPASVKLVGDFAFDSCSALSALTLTEGVEEIGEFAFSFCTSLKTVTVPDSIEKFGKGVFSFSTALETVDIGDGLKEISMELFRGCSALKEVNIGSGVEYIDNGAFGDCRALKEITLPDSVLRIETEAFGGCYNLEKITISPYTMFFESGALDSCDLPTVYSYEPSLAKTYAEENGHEFVSLGASPFIASGISGSDVYWILEADGTLEISGSGEIEKKSSSSAYLWYEHRDLIRSVEIGEGITSIPSGAFFFYKKLEAVSISDTVCTIGGNAFFGTGISTLEIPSSVTEIGANAFAYCTSLASVTIGRNVEAIGNGAFRNCAEGFTVYGYKGTAAEEYAASDEAITFVMLSIAEDIDGDGEVTAKDVLDVIGGMLNGIYSAKADLDGDGRLSLTDVLKVLKASAV